MPVPDLFASDRAPAFSVTGLSYHPSFLTPEEGARVAAFVDGGVWNDQMRRRVQHFGYRYDYKVRAIDESMRVSPLPSWAVRIGARLVKRGMFGELPDQLIVNEHLPGQGIAAHVDCVPCFGDTIASVSLLSPCMMSFESLGGGGSLDLDLEPDSVVVLSGEARHRWTHAIRPRASDVVVGARRPRTRRISLIFRTVLLDAAIIA